MVAIMHGMLAHHHATYKGGVIRDHHVCRIPEEIFTEVHLTPIRTIRRDTAGVAAVSAPWMTVPAP
jgi:hypothetical protein